MVDSRTSDHQAKRGRFAILAVFLALVPLGIGFGLGRYSVLLPGIREIESLVGVESLGAMLTDSQERALQDVYHQDALPIDFDAISWSVRNVPAPFVGHLPAPGEGLNSELNAWGMRAAGELLVPKPPNVYRIVITGGSTAYGSGAVDFERTIGGYLARMLNEDLSGETGLVYEVLLFANPAWASTHERIVIENRLEEVEADLVLSFSGSNDVHWGWRGRNILWFRSYYDQLYWDLVNGIYEKAGYGELPPMTSDSKEPVACSVVARRLRRNVELSDHSLSLDRVPYLFLLQPTLAVSKKMLSEREGEYLEDSDIADYFRACYSEINSELLGIGSGRVRYRSLTGVFDGLDGELFIDSYHFGGRGNSLIADSIYSELRDWRPEGLCGTGCPD